MTVVASQEELTALVREKGPEFDEKDLADIGNVNRDDVLATMADGATLGASAAMVLSSPAGWMGVALIGVGIGGGLLGTYWARSVGAGETVAGLLELAGMRRVGQVSAEGPYPAAVGHQVAHSYALLGFLASVAIGVVAACAVGALFATGVGGLVLLGAAAGYGVLAGFYGTAISDALSSLGSRAGPIKNGSTDVFIGGKGAARWVDEVECSKDPPTQIIVEGSDTIFVNNLPLARVGHKLLCGAVIDEGDSSIIVDRTTRRCAIPKSEVPLWARVAVDLAILASLYKGLKYGTAKKVSESTDPTHWPPNRGFLKEPSKLTLKPGTRIDRYGSEYGTFASPEGTPFPARALPGEAASKPYTVYEVVKSLEVDAGLTAPWFDQPGLGVQYELPASINQLIELGILRRITP